MAKHKKLSVSSKDNERNGSCSPKTPGNLSQSTKKSQKRPVFLPAHACEVSAASCGPHEFFAVLFFSA